MKIKVVCIVLLIICNTGRGLDVHASSAKDTSGIEVKRKPGDLPKFGFACELETEPLQKLFDTPGLISDIKAMNSNISMALIDYSPERAEIVRRLNKAGIPVIAWLVLPREQGYYMNASNAPQSAVCFENFEKWTKKYDLKWAAVGIDVEPNIKEFGEILKAGKGKLISTLVGRSLSLKRLKRAREARKAYSKLIRHIQSRGYPVQTYQLNFVADERRINSTLLDRVIDVVTTKGDKEALMIYTSFDHESGAAAVWSYGGDAEAIILGITGGGADTASKNVPLNWNELSRDLIVASHFTKDIGIFSLEGCVQQGFLPKLKNFDWNQSVLITGKTIEKGQKFRKMIQTILWVFTNVGYIILVLILVITWLVWRLYKRRHEERTRRIPIRPLRAQKNNHECPN
ncbi:MAG TPA: hypothetical protein VK179_01555 [Bacteroidales bacterium]|nr:hypothetical protein [Bacteroidales bacterium]